MNRTRSEHCDTGSYNGNRRICSMTGVVLLMLIMISAIASRAAAQDIIAPPISDDDLNEYVAILTLSDAQFKAIEPFYQEYLTQWRAWEDETVTPFQEAFRPGGNSSAFGAMSREQRLAFVVALHEKTASLDRHLFDRFPPMLTEEQIEKLPIVRDRRTRDCVATRCYVRGVVRYHDRDTRNGIRTDLRRLLREAEITSTERQSVEPILLEYERVLLARLREYEEVLSGARRDPNQVPSLENTLDIGAKAAVKPLLIHRKYMQMMLPHIAPKRAEAFEQAVNAAVYHRIEPDDRRAHRYFEHVKWDELAPEQVEAARTLQQDFEPQHREMSERIWRLFDDAADDGHFWQSGMNEPHENVRPMRKLIDDRDALNVATRDALREIIGVERLARIATAIGWMPDGADISSPLIIHSNPTVGVRFGHEQVGQMGVSGRSHIFPLSQISTATELYSFILPTYSSLLSCNAAQESALQRAWAQLCEASSGIEQRRKWLAERELGQWLLDDDNTLHTPTRHQLRDNHRERSAIYADIRKADEAFLAAIDATMTAEQSEPMQLLREIHHHWTYFRSPPFARVGPASLPRPVAYELADIRMLLIEADISDKGWEAAAPALDGYRTISADLIDRQIDAAWRVRKAAELVALENITREDGVYFMNLAPDSPQGETLRKAIADFMKTHEDHVALHAKTRERLVELLPEGEGLQFEMHYLRRVAEGNMIRDPAGRDAVHKALQLDDLTTSQRDEIINLLVELIEQDDAITRKMADHKIRSEFQMMQYRFDENGNFVNSRPRGMMRRPATSHYQEYQTLSERKLEGRETTYRRLRHLLNDAQEQAIGIDT